MSRTARQPHLGCTLSLISKANIRYEGILKGIDTDKCTLTLNNVQSYGTENRAAKIIPPTGSVCIVIDGVAWLLGQDALVRRLAWGTACGSRRLGKRCVGVIYESHSRRRVLCGVLYVVCSTRRALSGAL